MVPGVRLAGLAAPIRLLFSSIYSPNAATAAAASVVRRRISACADKRHSEQSCAGVTDEGFGIAAVGLEHLEAAVPGHVRNRVYS